MNISEFIKYEANSVYQDYVKDLNNRDKRYKDLLDKDLDSILDLVSDKLHHQPDILRERIKREIIEIILLYNIDTIKF